MIKRLQWVGLLLLTISAIAFIDSLDIKIQRLERIKMMPNDWFVTQRAWPQQDINYPVLLEARKQAEKMKQSAAGKSTPWQLAGPVNTGGRITDVVAPQQSVNTIFAGTANGGIFKSADGGSSWIPVFDDQLSLSIGDLEMDPGNPEIIYAGTGEANAGGGSVAYGGLGIFKSTDGGNSWQHKGLENSQYIGRIRVHPRERQKLFVAAMGKLFGTDDQRGVYRSLDGGDNWEQVLFINDSTGCIDIAINPEHPDTVFAAMWQRLRFPWGRTYGGMGSSIWRSTDGGDNWQQLGNGLPAPASNIGRIGLAIAPSNPQVMYAIYADDPGYFLGVYKSIDGGENWSQVNDWALSNLYSSYGWWFGNIRVHPDNPDMVYAMGLDIYRSPDGGQNWSVISNAIHVDQHGLEITGGFNTRLIAGNDGGIYISNNNGASWSHVESLPISQFYTCEVDEQYPQRAYGGTQDNGTIRTMTGQVNDWAEIFGGDGFYVIVDPQNNQNVYAEYQYGNLYKSTNGGGWFSYAMSGISGSDRHNWNTPVVMDPNNSSVLYYGTQRIYKSTDGAGFWQAISGDLSDGPATGQLPYGTITTIAADGDVVYAGLDDGNVWVTQNGGSSWQNISGELPQRWVTRVATDPDNAAVVYVSFSGFRQDDFLSHLYRSEDYGANWQDISGNLPEAPVNDIIVDPDRDSTLYAGSDVGVFVSRDLGENWAVIGVDLPNVPVTDLRLHSGSSNLVAATFGRSMYRIDLAAIFSSTPEPAQLPSQHQLAQNYPNPFNGSTRVRFSLVHGENIRLEIYDMLGRKIRTVARGMFASGEYQFNWDGLNEIGEQVAAGNYICRLRTATQMLTQKMTYLP